MAVTTPSNETRTYIHAFELAGLGIAPFEFIAEIDRGRRNHTICDFCGTSIRYEQIIQDSKGHNFKVGCECVAKTGDSGLIDMVKKAQADRKRAQKAAAEAAKLEAQRVKNGGLTDAEVRAQQWEAEQAAKKAAEAAAAEAAKLEAQRVNARVLEVMAPMVQNSIEYRQRCIDEVGGTYQIKADEPFASGTFMADMWAKLNSAPYTSMSLRQREVLADIVAKQNMRTAGKRRQQPFYDEIADALGLND
jgi:chemotaxis protein histidine kinase CheA